MYFHNFHSYCFNYTQLYWNIFENEEEIRQATNQTQVQ